MRRCSAGAVATKHFFSPSFTKARARARASLGSPAQTQMSNTISCYTTWRGTWNGGRTGKNRESRAAIKKKGDAVEEFSKPVILTTNALMFAALSDPFLTHFPNGGTNFCTVRDPGGQGTRPKRCELTDCGVIRDKQGKDAKVGPCTHNLDRLTPPILWF